MYTPHEPLTQEQVIALLRAAARSKGAERDLAILSLLLGTGMRINEAARLTVQDVLRKSTGWYVQCRTLKSGVPRLVPLSPPVFKALFNYLALWGQNHPILRLLETTEADRLFPLPEKPRIPLFQNPNGDALSSTAIGYIVSKLAMETGIISPARAIAGRLRTTFMEAYWRCNPGDTYGLTMLLGLRMPSLLHTLYVPPKETYLRSIYQDKLGFIDDWYRHLTE